MKKEAYFLSKNSIPYHLPNNQKWIIMEVSIGILGVCKDQIPNKDKTMPTFLLATTDRDSAKAAICSKIDELFNEFETEKMIPVFYKGKQIGHIDLKPEDLIKDKSEQIIHFDTKIPEELLEELKGKVNISIGCKTEKIND